MKYYAHFGHKDFILCLGYQSNVIKDYFLNYDECVSNDFVLTEGGRSVDLLTSESTTGGEANVEEPHRLSSLILPSPDHGSIPPLSEILHRERNTGQGIGPSENGVELRDSYVKSSLGSQLV